jgi:cytochrome P450
MYMEHATPPGPSGYPLVGNITQMFGAPFESIPAWRDKYGDIIHLKAGNETFYLIFDPDAARQVLVTDAEVFEKGEFQRGVFEPVTGTEGLFLSHGEPWRRQRRAIQPAFRREQVETYVETMVEHADSKTTYWHNGEIIDLKLEMEDLSLSILGQTLFGIDIRTGQDSLLRRMHSAINEKYHTSPLQYALPNWLPTPTNREFTEAIDQFEQELESLIAQRRGELIDTPSETTEYNDLLSQLIAIGLDDENDTQPLKAETIRDNMKGFVLGGQGTAALMLTYTWYLLATHPEVARRLRDELDETLGRDKPTMSELTSLDYLDGVLKESLRLYPPVYSLFREPTTDVTVNGYQIPEGATVMTPQFAIQRDERWFENPEAFEPERWVDGSTNDLDDFAYFPFGAGPKQCIGREFAMIEGKAIIATIAQQVEFEAKTDGFEQFASLTAQPTDSIYARVSKR